MTEFKVGDKIRRISPSVRPDLYGHVGEVLTIQEIDILTGEVWLEGRHFNSSIDRYELVEEAMDLTKIEKPFGLLDKATQQALKDHGGPYEFYQSGCWNGIINSYWVKHLTYRVQPQPEKTKVELELTQEELDTIKKVLGRTGL
jgi:hypothetical protein